MNGILLINKPKDYTSHDIVNIIRRKLGTKKVGHTGTLDPLATGLLVICVGQATKLVEYLTAETKTYIATALLGKTTTTDDITGDEITTELFSLSSENVRLAINSFTGEITQIPPIYSAIKVSGKKLYEYARKNQEVEIPSRNVTIYKSTLLTNQDIYTNNSPFITFETTVSKGTYIRTLISHIGKCLKCGATMSALERTQVGNYSLTQASSLDEVSEDKLLPMETILNSSNSIVLTDDIIERLKKGQRVKYVDSTLKNQTYFLTNDDKKLLGIVRYDVEFSLIRPKKIFNI